MKLRIFLLLILFFSSFSVFALTDSEAKAICLGSSVAISYGGGCAIPPVGVLPNHGYCPVRPSDGLLKCSLYYVVFDDCDSPKIWDIPSNSCINPDPDCSKQPGTELATWMQPPRQCVPVCEHGRDPVTHECIVPDPDCSKQPGTELATWTTPHSCVAVCQNGRDATTHQCLDCQGESNSAYPGVTGRFCPLTYPPPSNQSWVSCESDCPSPTFSCDPFFHPNTFANTVTKTCDPIPVCNPDSETYNPETNKCDAIPELPPIDVDPPSTPPTTTTSTTSTTITTSTTSGACQAGYHRDMYDNCVPDSVSTTTTTTTTPTGTNTVNTTTQTTGTSTGAAVTMTSTVGTATGTGGCQAGDSCDQSALKKNTKDTADKLQKMLDYKSGDLDLTGEPKGLDDKDLKEELKLAQDDLKKQFSDVKSSFDSIIEPLSTSSGLLPSWDFDLIKGNQVKVDFNKYSNELSIIGYAVIFLAYLIALSILIG